MTNRLLDRQARLLAYLTSGATIFDSEEGVVRDRGPEGLDRGMLRIEARFSHEKRMAKIRTVFPRSFRMLPDRAAMEREFAGACPPASVSRLENARQFQGFLEARWERNPPQPPWLRDVAACELALAQVRSGHDGRLARMGERAERNALRRGAGVVLLTCAYNVQPIFEDRANTAVKRRTLLAIAIPRGDAQPRIFELHPIAFQVLEALDHWTTPSALSLGPELDALMADLAQLGLVEVHG